MVIIEKAELDKAKREAKRFLEKAAELENAAKVRGQSLKGWGIGRERATLIRSAIDLRYALADITRDKRDW